ncbi:MULTISPECIES: hypothetical protein [Flavobacteriaceae]|uniref:hypothetical protein n=1 Tax=Flavobacteriaceae TaxID=49546 RepID=UPI001492277A|nr:MULTISPECIES: hypothetical protein [Allomuricauda]MDC6364832.1 hypothetical protein [Muricauda sp. AC10]
MVDYYKLPLALKQNVSTTYKKIREVVKGNNDIIRVDEDANLCLSVVGLGGNSDFFFKVSDPNLNTSNGNKITYKIDYAPKNHVSIAPIWQETDGDSVLKIMSRWLSILQGNNNIEIHPADSISGQYEDEFNDWFEIVEDDADKKAFDTPRQILISNVITKSILALKEAGFEDDDELIVEAEELKDDISKLTMKQGFDRIKRLYAKLKIKGGWDKVKLIYEVCEKEVIKMGFHFGTKMLGEKLANVIDTIVN